MNIYIYIYMHILITSESKPTFLNIHIFYFYVHLHTVMDWPIWLTYCKSRNDINTFTTFKYKKSGVVSLCICWPPRLKLCGPMMLRVKHHRRQMLWTQLFLSYMTCVSHFAKNVYRRSLQFSWTIHRRYIAAIWFSITVYQVVKNFQFRKPNNNKVQQT